MRQLFYLLAYLLFSVAALAQTDSVVARPDTNKPVVAPTVKTRDTTTLSKPRVSRRVDSAARNQPTIVAPDTPATIKTIKPLFTGEWKLDTRKNLVWQVMSHHPYFGFNQEALVFRSDKKIFRGKELLFYSIILLLLLYALLRTAFPKYFADLFRLFFRTTIKQRQIKEQLMQTPLPSILLNGFFAISAGMYLSFILGHFGLNPVGNFWLLFAYCVVGIGAIYLVKFLSLKVTGWIFRVKEAADSYIFIVFLINKMAGLLLLPFIVLLAFTGGSLYSTSLNLSYFVLVVLLAYRFILTYSVVRNQVRVNPFHFFLYLCAFEIAPLLLVYKLLLIYFGIST